MLLEKWSWRAGIKARPAGKRLLELLLCINCLIGFLQAQNLDLSNSTSSTIHRGLSGTGIALIEGNSSGDINPAGLAGIQEQQVSMSALFVHHKYQLVNERQEDELARIFKWSRLEKSFQNLHVASPFGERMGVSMGIRNTISPFLFNQQRAITWSPLYNQLTQGSIYAPYLALGYQITENLSMGMMVKGNYGTIVSEIHGENHGNDEEKWARLGSRVSGWGVKAGYHFGAENYQLGVTLEPSRKLDIQYSKDMSPDGLYVNLFPESDHSSWVTPLSLGVGTAFNFSRELLITMDLEAFRLDPDMPGFNLFEYGGAAVGGDLITYRFGALYTRSGVAPISIGYAYLPQAYTSTGKTVLANNSTQVSNSDRIIKQLYTAGTSKAFQNSVINVALEFSVLTWEGELNTYISVNDAYTEQGFGLVVEWLYKL